MFLVDSKNKTTEEIKEISFKEVELNQYDHLLSTGSGISGCPFSFIDTKNYCSVDLGGRRIIKKFNKNLFDYLYSNKEDIEKAYGDNLYWERLDDKKMSRISYRLENVSIFNKEDWDTMITFLTENMIKLDKIFRRYIDSFNRHKN